MFDENFRVVDYVSAHLDDQATKYLFWRSMADRVLYTKPWSLIWICEAWLRDAHGFPHMASRNMPIVGEQLHVVGMDRSGQTTRVAWNIRRTDPQATPQLEEVSPDDDPVSAWPFNYLVPLQKAFEKLRQSSAK